MAVGGPRQPNGSAAATYSAIIDLIRSSGVVSRVELAERTGLTPATISRIVKQLLNDGVVVETGVGDRTGGKRRTLLQLNGRARHAVGVTLDFERNTYLLADLSGAVIARIEATGTGGDPPQVVIERVGREVTELITRAGVDRATVLGVGVAVAGRQDAGHHVLRSNPHATDWEMFDIESALTGLVDLPTAIENDSTCAAIGEYWVGRISASVDVATVYMATGIGLGLVVGGDIYRGASSNVGEIGHMVLDVNGPPCWCGSRGCLEALAAPRRIIELAVATPGLAAELGLRGEPDTVRHDFTLVADAAVAGHEGANKIIEESAFYLSRALVSVTNLLDLDQIILAGPGFAVAGDIYRRVAWQALEQLSFVRSIHPTAIELSRFTDNAALGAASLVLHNQLTARSRSGRVALPTR